MKVKKVLIILFVLVVAFTCLLPLPFRIGYAMYIDKKFLGNVHNKAEAAAVIEIVASDVNITLSTPSLILRFLPPDAFTPPSELLQNVRSAGGIETEFLTTTKPIPFSSQKIENSMLYKGEEEISTEGLDGVRTIITQVTRIGGETVHEKVVSDTVTTEPVNQVISVGTKVRPSGVGTGTFSYPLSVISVSSDFGYRWNRQHAGIDLAADSGTPITAADSGTVIFSGVCSGYGNLIILDHQNGYTTYYAHCSVLYAAEGAKPEKGEIIAEVGSTGNSTGPHLHFEIRKDDEPQNPASFLPGMT